MEHALWRSLWRGELSGTWAVIASITRRRRRPKVRSRSYLERRPNKENVRSTGLWSLKNKCNERIAINPTDAVGGISHIQSCACRLGINHPPTSVGGIFAGIVTFIFQRPTAGTANFFLRRRRMTHLIGSREEWIAARLELLEAEKELTRRSDELARRRQELPWVRIDKEYQFETDEGSASLADLFRGRSQLLVYPFMFGPDYAAGCPSCSAIAHGFKGIAIHLANHDVMLWAVSRAPLEKLQAYKRRMGWTFPWASSLGSDFNFDFNVHLTEEQQGKGGTEYNYEREEVWRPEDSEGVVTLAAMSETDPATYVRERPGMSAFALEDGVVYHTYSTYARGLDGLWGM